VERGTLPSLGLAAVEQAWRPLCTSLASVKKRQCFEEISVSSRVRTARLLHSFCGFTVDVIPCTTTVGRPVYTLVGFRCLRGSHKTVVAWTSEFVPPGRLVNPKHGGVFRMPCHVQDCTCSAEDHDLFRGVPTRG
jgi:hypothetical protein